MDFRLTPKQLIIFLLIFVNIIHIVRPYHADLVVQFVNSTYISRNLEGNESWKFPNCEEIFGTKGTYIKELEIYNTNIHQLDQEELKKLPNLETLVVENNKKLRNIPSGTFQFNTKLTHIILKANSLDFVGKNAFGALFTDEFSVGELDLSFNKLQRFPAFLSPVPALKTLTLDENPITEVANNAFENLTHLETLSIQNTLITRLVGEMFRNNERLHYANFSNNKRLRWIALNAFVGANNLRILDLSNTAISDVSHAGLERLTELTLQNTPNLWQISDGIVGIPTLKKVHVAIQQRWLCCAFKMKRSIIRVSQQHNSNKEKIVNPCVTQHQTSSPTVTGKLIQPTSQPSSTQNVSTTKDYVSTTEDASGGFIGRRRRALLQFNGFNVFFTTPKDNETFVVTPSKAGILDHFTDESFIKNTVVHTRGVICNPNITGTEYNEETLEPVDCSPGPDALRPCDDIMGNVFLTSISWLVSIIALLGNAMVFCVLILSRRTVSVTKYLLINLSFADLILAFYLFILVSASGHTHGNYYNYVREWQYGGGCSLAGFLAVFSSQLSMLILVIITIERYFAIVYAMHFDRRMSKNHAMLCMAVAWGFSLMMAVLPLVGVNSYSDVAICLPFRTENGGDKAYIGLLLLVNLMFFIFVFSSYVRMFWVVRSPHLDNVPQRRDSEVAKRMGLLVFTDFFCWGPIAFVGLVSAFGGADALGVTVKNSKFLLVIFFPINALCNPFLYAVSTNSFKRDFYDLMIRCGLCQDCIARRNEGMYTNSMSHKQMSTGETLRSTVSRNSMLDRLSLGKVLQKRRNWDNELKTSTTPSHSMKSAHETPVSDDCNNEVEPAFFNPSQMRDSDSLSSIPDVNQNKKKQQCLGESSVKQGKDISETTDAPHFSRYDLSPEALGRNKQTTNV